MPDYPDSRVKKILDEKKITYQMGIDDDFAVILDLENGRNQTAFIKSKTTTYAGKEIRDIWSVGYESDGPLPDDIANLLLQANHRYKTGSWEIMDEESVYLAIFKLQIPADADANTLLTALVSTMKSADDMERTTLGTDKF